MKRNLSQSRRPLMKTMGIALLAASLVVGPGLAGVATAVEPSPTPTTSSATGDTAKTAAPTPSATPSPPPPEATAQPSAEATQSMAEAVGLGGAEMGQRSARVTASSPATMKRLTSETLSTEGTWMPTFGVQGLDVSAHQPSVDWQQQWNMGARFAYVKASEGNYYTNELFNSQYQGSRNVGMIRGAYHFAIPNWSSGADQARYFVQNGGGWTADGYTMPPVLDFEFNPYEGRTINGFYFGNTCYNMSPAQLQSWVSDFGSTVRSMTGRLPVIYTNTNWWNQCLGNPSGFGDYPLWVAAYPSAPTNNAGPIPTGSWSTYSIWQYSSTGPFAGDSNVWNGEYADLKRFATYSDGYASIFLKSTNSNTIYLVNGQTKYPIPDWETYQLYARASFLETASQQYVDSLVTGNAVGRFARSAAGSIYLIDSGRRFHVASCTAMYDFGGGSCVGWVPLADNQLSGYSDGGTLTNATVSPTGRQYIVSGRTKREFFDGASLAQAGFPAGTTMLSDAVTAGMPQAAAAPVVRPDVIVVDRDTRQPYIHTAGKLLPVPASVNAENTWSRSLTAGALDPQSIAKMAKGNAFNGYAVSSSGADRYVIGASQKYRMTDPAQWPEPTVTFSDFLLNSIESGPAITDTSFVKSSSSAVVYRRTKSNAREITDLNTLTQLGFGQIPPIYTMAGTTLNSLPKGPALLPLAKLAVGDVNPAVYLVDGPDKVLQLEDFRISDGLGVKGFTRVPQASLAPYTTTGKVLPALRCGSNTYLGYRGGLWRLPASSATAQLPSQTLEASTCLALPGTAGEISSMVFVKALDSAVVYVMADGTKRPVNSWNRLVELNGDGASPVIAEYSRSALDSVPTGSPA
jgi:GH25 family lysozyme M1 (1,4-beta-N-acetylmuramidase)